MHCHTRNLRDQPERYGYAAVLAAGQRLVDSDTPTGGRVTSRPAVYMPTLTDTMDPVHSYAALVKGNLVVGGKEKEVTKGGKRRWRGT